MSTSVTDRSVERPRIEAPITLTDPPPRTLGLLETTGPWGNLGISLLLPVAATFAIDPANGWSASLVSLAVAASLTALVSLPRVVRRT